MSEEHRRKPGFIESLRLSWPSVLAAIISCGAIIFNNGNFYGGVTVWRAEVDKWRVEQAELVKNQNKRLDIVENFNRDNFSSIKENSNQIKSVIGQINLHDFEINSVKQRVTVLEHHR